MSRISKLVETFSEVKSSWDAAFLKNIDLGLDTDVMGKPYSRSDLVYVCITTTARAISQVPLIVEKKTGEGYEQVNPDDPFQLLLHRPNYLMDIYKFIEAIIGYLMLDGHVWLIPFPPGTNRTPDSIWVVNKRYIKAVKDNSGHLSAWRYTPGRNFQSGVKLLPEEVVSIWLWNPDNPIMGLSPLEAGKMAISTDYKAAYYNSMFFKNGATASGVLSTPNKLSETQFKRAKEQLQSRHVGFRDAHKLMVLEQGLQFTQTNISHKDMEFYDLRRFDQERILQIFGMKKSIISVTDDINYATAKEQRREWWQDTNLPLMRLVLSALNFHFFPEKDFRIAFDLSSIEALHEDYSSKVETGLNLAKLGFTANEINEKLELGFDSKPWRDYAYIPISVVPVSDTPPAPSASEGQNLQIEAPKEKVDPVAQPVLPASFTEVVHTKSKDIVPSREQMLEVAWKGFIRSVTPIENSFESKVKRIFYQMRKKTLKLLYQKSAGDITDETFDKEKEEISKAAGRTYQDAMLAGAEALSNEIGMSVNLDLNDPVALNYLLTKKLKVKNVVDTIKKQLNTQLHEGMANGESIDEMAERVKNVFNASSHRARTIARTEVVGSSNFGRHEAIKQTGFKEVEWFTALDERVRDTHIVMHGQKKRTNEPWIVGGASIMHPGDYNGPAGEIINCRCIEVVVPGSLEMPGGESKPTPEAVERAKMPEISRKAYDMIAEIGTFTDKDFRRWKREFGVSKEDLLKMQKKLEQIIGTDDLPVLIDRQLEFHSKSRADLYETGRMKNQFELKEKATSSGMLANKVNKNRDMWEKNLTHGVLNESEEYKKLSSGSYFSDQAAKERPIYGSIGTDKSNRLRVSKSYGKVGFQLKKEVVDSRMTFCQGNSSGFIELPGGDNSYNRERWGEAQGTAKGNKSLIYTFLNESKSEFTEGTTAEWVSDFLKGDLSRLGHIKDNWAPYVESQIYGGVSMADVEKIRYFGDEIPDHIKELAEKWGLKIIKESI